MLGQKTTTQNHPRQKSTENIHKHQTQNFRRISPFGIASVKKKKKKFKARKARTRWYRGPFRRFINTRLTNKMTRALVILISGEELLNCAHTAKVNVS